MLPVSPATGVPSGPRVSAGADDDGSAGARLDGGGLAGAGGSLVVPAAPSATVVVRGDIEAGAGRGAGAGTVVGTDRLDSGVNPHPAAALGNSAGRMSTTGDRVSPVIGAIPDVGIGAAGAGAGACLDESDLAGAGRGVGVIGAGVGDESEQDAQKKLLDPSGAFASLAKLERDESGDWKAIDWDAFDEANKEKLIITGDTCQVDPYSPDQCIKSKFLSAREILLGIEFPEGCSDDTLKSLVKEAFILKGYTFLGLSSGGRGESPLCFMPSKGVSTDRVCIRVGGYIADEIRAKRALRVSYFLPILFKQQATFIQQRYSDFNSTPGWTVLPVPTYMVKWPTGRCMLLQDFVRLNHSSRSRTLESNEAVEQIVIAGFIANISRLASYKIASDNDKRIMYLFDLGDFFSLSRFNEMFILKEVTLTYPGEDQELYTICNGRRDKTNISDYVRWRFSQCAFDSFRRFLRE